MPNRVLIADDYLMIRQVFENAVRYAPQYTLAASVSTAEDAVRVCLSEQVDLAIMDVLFPGGMSGLEAARLIKEKKPATKILVVTSMPETTYIRRAKEIGIESFWYKEVQEQPILEIMDRTTSGESVYPTGQLHVPFGDADSTEFTDRELDVLRLLVSGASNKTIASELSISENTVKFHINNMLQKTGFHSRLELAVRARDIGLVVLD
ncbi:MAG: response regulator transcription factor [Clostridia bacterium]|nr:response regulator transcription factor [Clostridia bacterium]MBR3196645.1 response regulator transcription factor [Clostridia bacterium]